jgi:predicted dehydrogenase/nucleoside-diphosphate-sugar epimerase
MMNEIRAGVVGAGYVSAHHLRALRDLPFVKLAGICDFDRQRASAMAARFGVENVYGSLREMAAARPNVIHILTPPESHCKLTLEALEMGCHVFVEKPMAESAAECDEMIAAARGKGLILSVNHSARFDPAVLEGLEHARRGALGETLNVLMVRSSDYPPYAGGPLPAPFRQGSYPFRDLGVHALYVLEAFLGNVRDLRVKHYSTGTNPLLTFDEWRAEAECEKGTGHIFLSWNARPMQSEIQVQGTRGVVHMDSFLQTCTLNRTLPGPKHIGIVINGFFGGLKQAWLAPWNMVRFVLGTLKPSPGIYNSVQAFHRALHAGTPPPVTPEEGRRVVAWVEQTGRAADEEKARELEYERTRALPPARILVTGANGFLGSALLKRLRERGDAVRVLLRRPPAPGSPAHPDTPGSPVSAVYGSLGEPGVVDHAVAGVDVVYHVGAAMKGGPLEFEQGTIWGTQNIIDSCRRHGIRRLIYVSSMSVFDHAGHPDGIVVREESPYEPFPDQRGAYTQTKLRAETMVLEAAAKGLPAVVIRPGQIFGPGAERVTPNGVIGIAGQWLLAGNGQRPLPLVYRDDVVDALLRAEVADAAIGQVINVVDTVAVVRQNEYLHAAAPALEGITVRRVPVPLLMLLASGVELLGSILKRSVPLTRYRIRSLKPLWPFDPGKAETLLGWKPAIGVREGLRRTFGQRNAAAETARAITR